jgi:hypothetical protein
LHGRRSKSTRPGPAPIESRRPLPSQSAPVHPPADRREAHHVEASGHVERELPPKVGGERTKDEKDEPPNEGIRQ